MIIQIAGTSGSGKSHLMRSFIAWAREHGTVEAVFTEGRKPPLGYMIKIKGRSRCIFILGAYNSPTGGCDTIRDVREVYNLIAEKYENNSIDLLFEGLFVMNHTRGPQFVETLPDPSVFKIIQLTTPYATCVASINARREERGEGKLHTKANTKSNFVRAGNYCNKMRNSGARVFKVPRELGLKTVLTLLDL